MPEQEWLTQEEAAQKLKIALDTMRRYVREGRFPRTKVGKRYLIPSNAIGDYLSSNLQYASPPTQSQATPKPSLPKEPQKTRPHKERRTERRKPPN